MVIAIIGLLASVILASVDSARTKAQYARNMELDAGTYHNVGDSLVGQWLFDECANSTAYDSSGFNNHGSFFGTPVWSSNTPFGKGCSLQLDGSSYVHTTFNPSTYLTAGYTVAVWASTSIATSDALWRPIIGDASGDIFYVGSVSASQNSLNVNFNGVSRNIVSSQFALNDGKWHFVVVTIVPNQNITLYVDGAQIYQGLTPGAQSTTGVDIGHDQRAEFWKGSIDNVRFFQSALSSSEVRSLYLAEAPRHGVAFVGSFGVPSYLR